MREASLAASRRYSYPDDRAAERRGGRASGAPSRLGRVFAARRLGFVISVGFLALAGIGVPMNALFFQDGRHPAPLFAQAPAPTKQEIAKNETPKSAATAQVTPPARPVQAEPARVDAIAAAIDPPRAPTKPEAVKMDSAKTGSVKPEAKKRAPEKRRDAIAQLIAPAPAPATGPDATVLAAQQALLRLGYVVRADGVMGGATRQAIEKFERDSGLPATGKVTPKLMKQLVAQSGQTPR